MWHIVRGVAAHCNSKGCGRSVVHHKGCGSSVAHCKDIAMAETRKPVYSKPLEGGSLSSNSLFSLVQELLSQIACSR